MISEYQIKKSMSVEYAFKSVDDFPSASRNADPFLYPGIRPENSFLLSGEQVYDISAQRIDDSLAFTVATPDGDKPIDEFLEQKGAEPMSERVAILGYGANMCPASIHAKFSKVGRDDALVVPTIYGNLAAHDVVWSGGPGVNGNFIANLYSGPETQGTSVEVGINFLTREQLLVMHATELSYDLCEVEVEVDGVAVNALVYAGVDDILQKDGMPVAVHALRATGRTLPVATTYELLDDMLSDDELVAGFEKAGAITPNTTPEDYIESNQRLSHMPGAKLERKRIVHSIMAANGKSRSYKLPVDTSKMRSWANPSTIPTYGDRQKGIIHNDVYVLPSQEIPKDSWADESKRRLVMKSMSTHLMRMTDLSESTHES